MTKLQNILCAILSPRAATAIRSISLLVAIALALSTAEISCATLPVKSFPVLSPQTIAQLSHKSAILSSPSLPMSNSNSNGQKESAELHGPSMDMAGQYGGYGGEEVFAGEGADQDMELVDNDDESVQLQELAKRAPNKWQGLQGGWGKRAPNNWNKLSAAWGKRRVQNQAAWNNLSGMWGKKRAKWNELSGMWGKRAAWRDMSGGWGKKKRSNAPHWNKLRGMWGKRSALPVESSQQMVDEQQQQQQDQMMPQFSSGMDNSQYSGIPEQSKKDH